MVAVGGSARDGREGRPATAEDLRVVEVSTGTSNAFGAQACAQDPGDFARRPPGNISFKDPGAGDAVRQAARRAGAARERDQQVYQMALARRVQQEDGSSVLKVLESLRA